MTRRQIAYLRALGRGETPPKGAAKSLERQGYIWINRAGGRAELVLSPKGRGIVYRGEVWRCP